MPLEPGSRLGPYEILHPLGAGGMGEVYRARDARLGRDVALKVLPEEVARDPERLARFGREAHLLASLNHPHIAAIYGVEDDGPRRALVLELVEGPTLAERIASGALPVDDAVALALQIAEAIEAAHEQGVIHRDLKPANVKLTPGGEVKVLDFGLAKALEGESATADVSHSPTLTAAATRAGVILGTAAYMSPEQARGKVADKRADIWAFGCVLLEMLTGRRAFGGETVSDTLAAVLTREPDWAALPVRTPEPVRSLLRRCLERDPRLRLRDIGEARIALAGPLAPGASVTTGTAVSTPRRSWGWLALGGVAAAIAGAAVAAMALRPAPAAAVIGSVSLPRGVVPEPILETPGPVAVSPDNRALAFCARSGEGRTILWVRDLDEAAARPLAGTEGARRPFWSPDGRSIGFFTGAAMKRIPASGGSTTTLAAVADARGGTWSRDGTILFAGDYTGGLSRIPEAGGEPRPATTLDTASGEVTHRYPTFLPDGRHFLFLARKAGAGAGEAPAVMVAALDDPVHRPVLQTASNVAFSAGHLLFARERALMAVPFDLDRLETSGDARPIVEDLLVDERFSLAVFSASERGLLAYQGGRASYLTQWVWVDRAGRRLGVLDEPGLHYGAGGIAIAPDGRSCALARLDATTGNAAVWVVDLATGTRRQLESSGEDQSTPVWSTDGKYIAWASSGSSAGIWVRATSGGGSSRRVYANTGDKSAPMSFTPDGRRLVIIDATLPTDADLLEIPVDGGESRRIAAHSGRDEWAALSPDGRWLATQSQESGQPEIYVQPYPGPGGRRQVSREGGSDPRWRGDGRELYFFDARNFLVATTIVADAEGLSIAGTEELFQVRESWSNRYAAARDGQRFLVRMPVETADPSPITFVTDWPAILAAR